MNTEELIAKVNRWLGVYGAEFVADSGSLTANPTTVHGSINGKPVRLEFSISNEHPDYDYGVWLYSNKTTQPLGRGNGGSSFSDAIGNYQWKNALSDLEAI